MIVQNDQNYRLSQFSFFFINWRDKTQTYLQSTMKKKNNYPIEYKKCPLTVPAHQPSHPSVIGWQNIPFTFCRVKFAYCDISNSIDTVQVKTIDIIVIWRQIHWRVDTETHGTIHHTAIRLIVCVPAVFVCLVRLLSASVILILFVAPRILVAKYFQFSTQRAREFNEKPTLL